MQRVGLYKCGGICDNESLVGIMSIDDALYKIGCLDVSAETHSRLKKMVLNGHSTPVGEKSFTFYLKLLEEFPDNKFYLTHENSYFTLLQIDTDCFNSCGYHEKFGKEGLELISEVFCKCSLKDLIVSWMSEGVYSDLKTAIFDCCSSVKRFLTVLAVTLRDIPDIFTLRCIPDYVGVEFYTEYYLIDVVKGDFRIRKCVEMK